MDGLQANGFSYTHHAYSSTRICMVELTPSETAILGLIAERPRHGYEIDEIIEARGLREWAGIGFSSIYFLLQRLERKGCVRPQGRPAGPKARKLYAITRQGQDALEASSLRLLAELPPPAAPVLTGLANWPSLDPARATGALKARRKAVEAEIARLAERWTGRKPLPVFADRMFAYGLALAEAERAWLDATIAELERADGQARP
ncbi:MAG TPA: PadR family transcriptional regulator [Croceibacterium sp.]